MELPLLITGEEVDGPMESVSVAIFDTSGENDYNITDSDNDSDQGIICDDSSLGTTDVGEWESKILNNLLGDYDFNEDMDKGVYVGYGFDAQAMDPENYNNKMILNTLQLIREEGNTLLEARRGVKWGEEEWLDEEEPAVRMSLCAVERERQDEEWNDEED
jgi:hypothetical protein